MTSKRELFEKWAEDDHVLAHVDSTADGVDLPQHLIGNPALTLKLSYRFQGTMEHDEHSIVAFLRFGTDYHRCVLPWTSIWGFTSAGGEQKIFPEDIPPSLLEQLPWEKLKEISERILGTKKETPPETTEPRKPPILRRIK